MSITDQITWLINNKKIRSNMKFPSLSLTHKLLKPFKRKDSKVHSSHTPEITLYDKIEEIISIVDIYRHSQEIVLKFYHLTEIQQQLTITTLIEHNLVETLEVILQSNYDVNYLIKGQSPLHFAIKNQNLNMLKIFIKYKANLELKDIYKETALNCAVRTGNIDIIKYLLEQGAEVNTQASDNSTPLEYAIHNGDIKSVNLLEKYGALLGSSYLVKNL